MTNTEYYTEIKTLLPGCNPYDVDVELMRFREQFQIEVLCRATIDPVNRPSDSMPRSRGLFNIEPTSTFGVGRVTPKWVFDPDESRDKLHHLRCHLVRTIHPYDDDVSIIHNGTPCRTN
jgi:hypothetical protein